MITRIWHGVTPVTKSDEYLNLMRTVAIPDYRSTPGNQGAYALRRIEGDRAHFLMVTFWESEAAIRAFAGDDGEDLPSRQAEVDEQAELLAPRQHLRRKARSNSEQADRDRHGLQPVGHGEASVEDAQR